MTPFLTDTPKKNDKGAHPILLLLALSKTWNWVAERRRFQNNAGYLKLVFSDLPPGGKSMFQVEKKLRKLRIERRPYPRLPRGSRGVAGREGCPGLSGALPHRVTRSHRGVYQRAVVLARSHQVDQEIKKNSFANSPDHEWRGLIPNTILGKADLNSFTET